MEDKDYQQALATYSLDTLLDISVHIDQKAYPHRYQWIQSEIDNRKKGIPAEPVPTPVGFRLGTQEIYAGFWHRLGATVIDALLVFVPLSLWFQWCFLLPSPYSLMLLIPLPVIFPAYNIVCLSIWGQTPGKRAVGIQVFTHTGAPVSTRRALIRHSVDVLLAAMMLTTLLVGLILYSSSGTGPGSGISSFHRQLPAWDLLDDLWDVWIWSEIGVLLLNRYKKGLHDFLAGTFVVHQHKVNELQTNHPGEVSDWIKDGWKQRLHTSANLVGLKKLHSVERQAGVTKVRGEKIHE